MSEFKVQVVKVTNVEKHPNADTLSIAKVNGDYPVIFQTGTYNEGDLAVYLPIDSIVPDTEQWAFLAGHRRIKAKKLRGVFSMGMLTPLMQVVDGETGHVLVDASEFKEGDDVQDLFGIEKYEPKLPGHAAAQLKGTWARVAPEWFPRYTDIEGLRKNTDVLVEGEEVVITEKIHGSNARWSIGEIVDDHTIDWVVGSHNVVFKSGEPNSWFDALQHHQELVIAMTDNPKLVFFGELYGNVQDLKYGLGQERRIRLFDIFDGNQMKYLDYVDFQQMAEKYNLPTAPLLYRGPWDNSLRSLAEGKTTFGGDHVREGFVVRPVKERYDRRCGRVILKMIGEGYLLRKNA